jgi:hypothetical protein
VKLPLSFIFNGKLISEVNVKRPGTEAIADCKDKMQDDDFYGGMAIFAAGSIAGLIDSDEKEIIEKSTIRQAVQVMPYRDVEFVLLQAMIKTGIDDVIEGIYPCPRCKKNYIPADPDPEYNRNDPEHNSDDADRISKLRTVFLAGNPREFLIEFETAVETIDADSDEVIDRVESVKLRDPIMDDMIRAARKVGIGNSDRFNSAIYAEATLECNGQKVDKKWKNEWGTWLYDKIDYTDSKRIQAEMRKYGTKTSVERTCRHCGKKWEAEVDTGSFFASGLGA